MRPGSGDSAAMLLFILASFFHPYLTEDSENGLAPRREWAAEAALHSLENVLAVPGQVGRVRPQRRVARKEDFQTVEFAHGSLVGTFLAEVLTCNNDREIIRKGPQAVVKEPLGLLAKGEAVAGVVSAQHGSGLFQAHSWVKLKFGDELRRELGTFQHSWSG
jgi:hypothetical protein